MEDRARLFERDDAITNAASLVFRLKEAFNAEILGYEVEPDGTVDLRVRIHFGHESLE
jgi:hypothetical protein